MRTLVIDSATAACSVALFEGSHIVAGEFRLMGRGHAEALVPMVAALPDHGKAARIAVALGPGSFTGVRVGLAAARGLALAWGSEVLGYPTLGLVAAMARADLGEIPVGVAMTGGHGEWFVQSFTAEGRAGNALSSLSPAAAIATFQAEVIVGNQAEAAVALRGHGRAIVLEPDARAFACMPTNHLTPTLEPLYGRAPDARPLDPEPR